MNETTSDRYTLAEARVILRRQLCLDARGHDLEQHVVETYAGVVSITIRCDRCQQTFGEVDR